MSICVRCVFRCVQEFVCMCNECSVCMGVYVWLRVDVCEYLCMCESVFGCACKCLCVLACVCVY